MIEVIVSSSSDARRLHKEKVLREFPQANILDDTIASIDILRSYAYPSLFEETPLIVIAPFLLEAQTLSKEQLRELAASPTQFYLYERSITADLKKMINALGTLSTLESGEKKKPAASLFYEASALVVEQSKLKRWQHLQELMQKEAPEAFIGIVYWKLRDMATKGNVQSKLLYDALINAHAQAWIQGTPLANALEKVLLTN